MPRSRSVPKPPSCSLSSVWLRSWQLPRRGPRYTPQSPTNDVIALTTAPDALPAGVIARKLDPRRTLRFELLWRDETPSPALAEFVTLAAANAQVPQSSRSLAAVA